MIGYGPNHQSMIDTTPDVKIAELQVKVEELDQINNKMQPLVYFTVAICSIAIGVSIGYVAGRLLKK